MWCTYDTWCLMHDTYAIYDTWHVMFGTWYVTHDTWHMIPDVWYMIRDSWHIIHNLWYMVRDTWCMVRDTDPCRHPAVFTLANCVTAGVRADRRSRHLCCLLPAACRCPVVVGLTQLPFYLHDTTLMPEVTATAWIRVVKNTYMYIKTSRQQH